MKTLAILLMSAVPALASVPENTPPNDAQTVSQAVAMKENPAKRNATCGSPREMIIVVRDDRGSVVAIGKALVAPVC
jgi:hypothetical protein